MFRRLKSIFLDEGITNVLKRRNYIRNLKGKKVINLSLNNKPFKILLDESNGFVDKDIYKWGIYEKHILEIIITHLNENSVFVDIGANIGQHSLICSLYSKHVYSFEPNYKVYSQFCQSIKLNDIKNISTYNYGISDKEETRNLYIDTENFGHSSVLEKYKSDTIVSIKLCKLDKFLTNLDRIDVVKIDIEGYELDAILGNADFLSKYRPKIFLELNLEDYNSANLNNFIEFIKLNNYKIYSFNQKKILTDISDPKIGQNNVLLY